MCKKDATTPNAAPGLAGAFMAIVAVAATAAAVPAPVVSGGDCRSAVMHSQPLRAVAAVVAAACDLLGIERTHDTAAHPTPIAEVAALPQRPPVVPPLANIHSPAPPLRDALLNLPPPVC